MLFVLSGIIRSGSNSILIPSPLHSLQAPNGELNENERGSKSPSEMSQCGHAFLWEYIVSLPSIETTTTPFPTFSADCIESKSRLFSSVEGLSLSTTTSIVCFFCLSSLGNSVSSSPKHRFCYRVHRLARNPLATFRAMWDANPRK